jgi:hypothetical protein
MVYEYKHDYIQAFESLVVCTCFVLLSCYACLGFLLAHKLFFNETIFEVSSIHLYFRI